MIEYEKKDLEYLLSLFSERLIESAAGNHLSDLIHNALDKVMRIDGVNAVSLFLLNSDTLEFEQRASQPYSDRYNLQKVYEILLNQNHIGKAVTGLSLLMTEIYDEINNVNKYYFLCPLVTGNGVVGLLIMQKTMQEQVFSKEAEKVFITWLAQLSALIENIILRNEVEKSRLMLEQKLAAKTLTITQSKRELEAILNAVQAAILVIEPDTNSILSANPVAVSIIGDTVSNIVGKNVTEYFRHEKEMLLYDEQVRFSKNFESVIYSVRDIPVPILRSTATIQLGNQKLRIESFFDITDRKMNEIALRQANELLELKVQERTEDLQILVCKLRDEVVEREKAEIEVRNTLAKEMELNDLKSKFVSLVSHEFRTPLTIIRSAAQVLQKYHNQIQPEQLDSYLSRIIFTVDNMTDLMENVLFIGKTDNSKFTFNPKSLNFVDLVQGIIDDAKFNNNVSNEILLINGLLRDEHTVDEVLIRQIMLNLLTNAIKYSHDNGEITVSLEENAEEVSIIVQDRGIGIPDSEQSKIFEQFYRGSNVGIINGTGLGMTVVLRSLNLHKGRIEVQSKVNEGTTFKAILPKRYEY